jgi:predicted dehydrogenase
MKNFAVIGYGGQGAWHCSQILKSDVAHLCGTYDIKESRRMAATEAGIFVYDSNEAIFADPAVDAVVIATPNDVHDALAVAAFAAGKHVICEKPVEMSVRALDEMIAAAQKAGKIFTVHQNRRWDVDFLAMKEIAHSGQIGELINIESRIHGSRGIPSDWRCEKEHGGGMMLDWGVHLIDQILQICTQPIHKVYCTFSHITNQEVDDGFKLELTFENGSTAHVEVGTYNFLPLPRFYMKAENGTVLLTDWREKAQVAKCRHWHENDVLPVKTAAGLTKTMAPRDSVTMDTYEVEKPASDVHDFYRNVCLAIDGKAEQLIKHDEMRRVMRVMELAFESDEKKAPVEFTI